MTWRVQYWRNDSPYPVSHYYRGDEAEAEARQRANELEARVGTRKVEVERIERGPRRDFHFFPCDLSLSSAHQNPRENARNPPGERI